MFVAALVMWPDLCIKWPGNIYIVVKGDIRWKIRE